MRTKWPPHWIYYAFIGYISAFWVLMKAYLWSTNDGNASWTINGHQGLRQKKRRVAKNRRVAKSQIVLVIILILEKKFVPWQLIHGCRYCSINNTNELRLLVSSAFWVKKELTGGQISSKRKTGDGLKLVCLFLCHNHYIIQRTG